MDAWYLLDEALEHGVNSAEECMVAASIGLVSATPDDCRKAAHHWIDWEARIIEYQLRLARVRNQMRWAIEWCTK